MLGGYTRMAYFFKLRDFEKRFDTMDVEELKRWLVYWTEHAQRLAPKIRKIAMKRVHQVERAIELRSRDESH
jgi:branched-subunit amino acid aminotransferase/4-amino-4-deoxychorismate lyase